MRVIDEYQMLSITPWEKLIKQRWKKNKTKENVDIRGKKKENQRIHYILYNPYSKNPEHKQLALRIPITACERVAEAALQ